MKKLMLLTAAVVFTASVFAGQGTSAPVKKTVPQENAKTAKDKKEAPKTKEKKAPSKVKKTAVKKETKAAVNK